MSKRGLFLAVAVGVGLAIAQDGGQQQSPDKPCKVTEVGGPCCAGQVFFWVWCGEPPQQCVLEETVCDELLYCRPAEVGFLSCELAPCYQRTIYRSCRWLPGGEVCQFEGQGNYVRIEDGRRATGALCPAEPEGIPATSDRR